MAQANYPKLMGWMAENGITRKSLAIDLGMSYPALTRRLFGDKEFEMEEIKKLMIMSGCSFEELFL